MLVGPRWSHDESHYESHDESKLRIGLNMSHELVLREIGAKFTKNGVKLVSSACFQLARKDMFILEQILSFIRMKPANTSLFAPNLVDFIQGM